MKTIHLRRIFLLTFCLLTFFVAQSAFSTGSQHRRTSPKRSPSSKNVKKVQESKNKAKKAPKTKVGRTRWSKKMECLTCPRDSKGRIKRSKSVKNAFKRSNPCPATGRTSGPCKGFVIDHVIPLANGGKDDNSNMQWQTKAAAKAKDKWERKSRRW